MPVKYKLTYFNTRARGETSRFILAAGGVKYEDERIEGAKWPELKPATPWGFLPVLEVDGRKISQSGTINRFLAKQHDLAGKNAVEVALIDSVAETITDIREAFMAILQVEDEKQKEEKLKTFQEETLPNILKKVEDYLKKNKGGDEYFVGNKVSWGDLHMLAVMELIEPTIPEALAEFPKLAGLIQRVSELDKVAEWIKKRPQTNF